MVCDNFNSTCEKIKKWIQVQPEVKEESITDWMLFDLSDNLPNFKYVQFTRAEEGKLTGADWEWWILAANGAFGARIQAKKLKGINNVNALKYPNKTRGQLKKLISDALLNNLPAFYAFYSAQNDPSQCKKKYMNGGVYLVEASLIKDLLDKPITTIYDSYIHSISIPLPCFFCCPLANAVSTADPKRNFGLLNFLRMYFPSLIQENSIQGFKQQPPSYVLSIISEDDIAKISSISYDEIPEGLKGVVVLDFRNLSF